MACFYGEDKGHENREDASRTTNETAPIYTMISPNKRAIDLSLGSQILMPTHMRGTCTTDGVRQRQR